MKTQARLGDLTETMARILRTGRHGEWEFRGPSCAGGGRVLRGGTFEVTPDFRTLIILARKSELSPEMRSFGRLTIFADDSDETLYLHCATLITGDPQALAGDLPGELVARAWAGTEPTEPLAVLLARVFCVELKVPSHSISVLARADVPRTPPMLALLHTLRSMHLEAHPDRRFEDGRRR